MAEFCLDCWNTINQTAFTHKDVVLSGYEDFCEGCGDFLPVVVRYRFSYVLKRYLGLYPTKDIDNIPLASLSTEKAEQFK